MAWIIFEDDEETAYAPESALDVIASNYAKIKEFSEAYICNEDIAIIVPSLGRLSLMKFNVVCSFIFKF